MLPPYFLIGPLLAECSPHPHGKGFFQMKHSYTWWPVRIWGSTLSLHWLSCRKGAILNVSHAFGDAEVTSVEGQYLPSGLYSQRYLLVTCAQSFSCIWLWDPVDCSLPGSSVYEIFQARILEWVAILFSRGSSRPRDWTRVSCVGRWIHYHWATWEALVRDKMTLPQRANCLHHVWMEDVAVLRSGCSPTMSWGGI